MVVHVTSTTTGGNWKEFWLAASQPGGGDIPLMQYHLDHGVDPNYQHPEMESTALCEAVTAGNVEVVKFLLDYKSRENGKPLIDPTIPAAYENQTPLEIAMELRQHEIVDAILEALPKSTFDEESQYCKTVLVTLPRMTSTRKKLPQHQTDLMTHILKLGHRVILAFATEGEEDDDDNEKVSSLKEDLVKMKDTGNVKFWNMAMSEVSPFLLKQHASKIVPNAIDIWISFIAPRSEKKNLLDTTLQSYECLSQPKSKVSSPPSEILLILASTSIDDDTTRGQLSLLFQRFAADDQKVATKCNAMMLPLSWWGNLTYNFWKEGWLDSIRHLLLVAPSLAKNNNHSNLYIHKNMQTMPLLTATNTGSVNALL